jgi:integrase
VLVSRIRAILTTAKGNGHLKGKDNPAARELLAGPLKGKHKTKHYAAMDGEHLPALMARLLADDAELIRKCVAFLILTAARPSQARFAQWSEIDLKEGVWTIGDERMKSDVMHQVPLARQVVDMLKKLPRVEGNPYVFPGDNAGEPVADLDKVITHMGLRGAATIHGFRSTFSDYIGEEHDFAAEDREFALAHGLDPTAGAYRRKKALNKRRPMMQAYADHCFGVDKVVPLRVVGEAA